MVDVADRPGVAANIFRHIADENVNVTFSYVAVGNRMTIGASNIALTARARLHVEAGIPFPPASAIFPSGSGRSLGASKSMKFVKAIVGERETVTVGPQTSVRDAAALMARHQIGAVPVVDGDRLAGIFTERDVLARVVAAGLDPVATSIADVMSTQLVVADVGETCDACLQRMQQARVRHLIVLERGSLAGVLSLRDLIAVDLSEKDEAIALLNAYVHYVPVDSRAKAQT